MSVHGNEVIRLCSSSLAVPIIVIVAMQCDTIFRLGGRPPEDSHRRLRVTGPSTSYARQAAERCLLESSTTGEGESASFWEN